MTTPSHINPPSDPTEVWQPDERNYRNGLGLTSLILGIVGLSLAWVPIVNYLSVVLGVIGLVLAIVGFVRIRRGGANNPVVTVIGALISAAAIVVAFAVFAAFADAVDSSITEFDQEMEQLERDFDEADQQFQDEMDQLDAELACLDEAETAAEIEDCES